MRLTVLKTVSLCLWVCLIPHGATASLPEGAKRIHVFVALCDNESQGIVPVGEKIGNGDDPESNLYWGCSDGFGGFFKLFRFRGRNRVAARNPASQIHV